MQNKSDFKFVDRLSEGEEFVGMVEFQGRIYVASSFHLWIIIDDKLRVVEIQAMEDHNAR